MRLTIGGALLARCIAGWPLAWFLPAALCAAEALSAVLLWAGLCTPVWAAAAAAVALWRAYADPANLLAHFLLATIAVALALLGPGAYSVDAHLFGWQRIDVPGAHDRKDRRLPPKD